MIEDEFIPLVAGGSGELALNLLFAVGTDHHGKGVEDHGVPKSHAGEGVVLEVAEWGAAGGAFAEPFGGFCAFSDPFAAPLEVGVLFEEGVDALAGLFREFPGNFLSAGKTHGVFTSFLDEVFA